MKIDFDNLRRRAIRNYNDLIKKVRNTDRFPEESYDQIRPILERLREDIVTIACCYDPSAGINSLGNVEILEP